MADASVLRIVHAVRSDAFAGVERSILLSTQALVERGHCLTVVGGDRIRMCEHLLPLGVDWVPAASTYDVFPRCAVSSPPTSCTLT